MWRYDTAQAFKFWNPGNGGGFQIWFASSSPLLNTNALVYNSNGIIRSLLVKSTPSPGCWFLHWSKKSLSTFFFPSGTPTSFKNASNFGTAVTGSSLLWRNKYFKRGLRLAILSCTPIIRIQLQTSNYKKSRVWECQTIISWFTSLLIGWERSYYCLMTWKQCKIDDSSKSLCGMTS